MERSPIMGVDTRYISEWLRSQWAFDAIKLISGRSGPEAATDATGETDFSSLLSMLSAASDSASVPAEFNGLSASDALALLGEKFTSLGSITASEDLSAGGGMPTEEIDRIVAAAGSKFGVDPALVKAVIHAESNFRTDAVSPAGAKGLMQLMDSTARTVGVDNSLDAEQNIHGGTRFLRNLLHKYGGNVGVALAAYNAGPGRVDRLGIRTDMDLAERMELLPEETQRYVSKVLGYHQQYTDHIG
jgi:soluble lytic murein transglycosylase-like protein